jgi:hypothetical protein
MKNQSGLTMFAQVLIEYVEDLITASPKESFHKVDMLILLNAIKNDPVMLEMLQLCDSSERSTTPPSA